MISCLKTQMNYSRENWKKKSYHNTSTALSELWHHSIIIMLKSCFCQRIARALARWKLHKSRPEKLHAWKETKSSYVAQKRRKASIVINPFQSSCRCCLFAHRRVEIKYECLAIDVAAHRQLTDDRWINNSSKNDTAISNGYKEFFHEMCKTRCLRSVSWAGARREKIAQHVTRI